MVFAFYSPSLPGTTDYASRFRHIIVGLPLELLIISRRLSQLFLDLYMRGINLALEQMNIELELTIDLLLPKDEGLDAGSQNVPGCKWNWNSRL